VSHRTVDTLDRLLKDPGILDELSAILELYEVKRPRFALSPVTDFSLDMTLFGLGVLASVYLPLLLG
jgi:hypothetical protein